MIEPIETIRIYTPQGKAYYSDAAKTNIEFPVTNSCERSAKLMGDDYVRLVFKLPNKVVFDTYAFIEYDGQTFFLKETYRPAPKGCLKETVNGKEVVSSAYYAYDVKFVSIANMLTKPICYRHVVVKGAGGTQQTWDEPEISINGTLETLYQIIIGSIQQAASRLSASHYKDMLTSIATNGAFDNGAKPDGVQLTPNTKLVTFSFSGDNIANVCTSVANAYTEDGKDTEWYITEDTNHSCTLHFAKCESSDPAQVLSDYEWENNGTDRFARPYLNGGLTRVEYSQAWSDVPQVIVPYGADRNMSGISVVGIDETTQMQSTFGKRLRLDPNTTYNVHDKNGENAATITTDAHGAISNPNVNTGIEVTKFYNDIYPQCHFKITKVEVKNKRQSGETVPEYTCEGIAVDARYTKEYLAQKGMFPLRIEEATTLSVRFESGFLNGREFEIANKTHKDQGSTGYSLKFTIVADGSIEDGTLIPSGNFKPNVGDQFALFNMKMPAEFVSLAKQDLAQRAYEELLDLQNTRPEVKCTAEPFTFMQHTVAFGAVVQVSSELFGDKPFVSRIIAYSYKLTSPSNVQFSLASAVMQGTLSEMNNAISDVTHTAGGLEQRAINLSRRGWRDANEVADMLDSITSEMMLVGNERYQFGFTSAIQCVDSNNKFASLRIGYGSLQHTQEPYINYANRGLWEISGATLTKDVNGADLDPTTPYYLFAQVADDSNPAQLILTTDAHKSESEDDVPYLLLGILSSEFEGRRVFSRTNGYTAIEGGTITTEQIQDAGRNLIIDFQSNPPRIIARNGAEIIGNIRFKATDTKTAEEQLADLGIIANNAQSSADDALAAANEARYISYYTGGDLSLSYGYDNPKNAGLVSNLPRGTYKTAIASEDNGLAGYDGAKDGFEHSCLVWFKAGTYNNNVTIDVLSGMKNSILAVSDWGVDVTISQSADVAVFTCIKDIVQAVINGSAITNFPTNGTWTINGIQVLSLLSDAIDVAKAEIKENKEYTDSLITVLGDSLQNQIDGVVDSYFQEGKPTNTNYPANEWTTDELKKRHEGDTYTNIQQYTKLGASVWESGAIGVGAAYKSKAYTDCKYGMATSIRTKELLANQPNQLLYVPSGYTIYVSRFDSSGKYIGSYVESATSFKLPTDAAQIAIQLRASSNITPDIADTLGLCVNPDAGKSWRWCKGSSDNPATTWHWHEIADSDAVRALQNAAKAQDTADGKRRVFVAQPTPPYEVGDLWAQGSADGQDILRCKTAKTVGQSFAQADWEPAGSALETLKNLEVGVRNLFAQKYMLAWNNNSAGTTTLNTDTYGTYYAINENRLYHNTAGAANYNDILQGKVTFGASKQYCLKVKWRVASTQTSSGLYLGFKYTDGTRSEWIICAKNQTTPIEAQLISAKDKTVAGVVCTFGTIANTRIYEIQLTEGNKAPSGWIEAEEDKETGGENLYTGANPLTIAAKTINYNYVKILTGLQNGSKYVFSCGKSVVKAGSTTQYAVLLYDFTNNTAQQQRLLPVGSTRVEQAFTIPSTGTWDMLIYSGVDGSTAGISMEYTDIMVQKGNKATAYQTALSFLGKAIQDMSTDVAGGLLMTGVMMLKDTDNKTVTAGMSGLTTDESGNTDNVLLWGGGTYPEAFYAAQNANYNKSADGTPITTLLKKDGTGKIGVFRIEKDKVLVKTSNGSIVIDDDEGITIFDNTDKEKVLITPKTLNIGSLTSNSDYVNTISGTKTVPKSEITGTSGNAVYLLTLLNLSADAKKELSVRNLEVQFITDSLSPMTNNASAGYSFTIELSVSIGNDTQNASYSFYYTPAPKDTNGNPIGDPTTSTYGSTSCTLNASSVKKYSLVNGKKISVRVYATTNNCTLPTPKVTISCDECYVLNTPARTVIGNNGFFSMIDKNKLFAIINSGNKQEVYMKGLPTSNTDLQRGQLYNSSGTLKIKQ